MAKVKAAVRTIGDHKQRITINVSLEGIKIIDEKTEVFVDFYFVVNSNLCSHQKYLHRFLFPVTVHIHCVPKKTSTFLFVK